MVQQLGQISKIRPKQIQTLCPSLRINGQLPALIANVKETAFKNERISNFQGLVTLTLNRVILHTVVHYSSTSSYTPYFIKINVQWYADAAYEDTNPNRHSKKAA